MTPPGRRKAPTIRDVARAAEVSPALVSIVFRGAPGASQETRARVLAVAEQLGYRANRSASLMKLRRTKHLGVTFNPSSAFHAELVERIQETAAGAGYQIVLALATATHDEAHAVETLLSYRCEAVILLGSQLHQKSLRQLAQEVPLVLVGRSIDVDNVDVVRSNDHRGQALTVDHLVGLGHRDIVHVDGGPQPMAAQRRRGYRTAMRRHGLGDQARIVTGGDSERDGRRAAGELLRLDELPTAVCAFNDHCAIGIIDTLNREGMRLPEDCSVTGYDDSPVARLQAIDLTTVNQDAPALAESAVRAARNRLDGQAIPGGSVLEPRLVVRGSTASRQRDEPAGPA